MSEATRADWPPWVRRVFYVEALGKPGVFLARLAICLAFLVMAYVGIWNAQVYPVPLGYDAQGHINYAHVLLHDHRLPTQAESSEYQQPPGYYVLAGSAALLGQKLFGWHEDKPYFATLPEVSYRGAQLLNVALVLATGLILLALARIAAPDRPSVWAAALLFFAFLPVVAKTAAMFHPETLNMFLTATTILVATRALAQRRLSRRRALALALLLSAGLLVRSSALFTLIAVGLSLGAVFIVPKIRTPRTWPGVTATLGVVLVLAGGWLALYRIHVLGSTSALGQAIFHPTLRSSEVTRSDFGHLSPAAFRVPFRPNYVNQALPVTYTEIWGDWIGAFSWSSYQPGPWAPALKVMKDQTSIGLLPTALAIGGWLLLLARSLRRRRDLLVVAFVPLVASAGYFYRAWVFLNSDGDLLKASYLLTTAPVWALGFGIAFGALGRFRLVRAGVAVCLVVFAVLELRFMLYGLRDHHPIF